MKKIIPFIATVAVHFCLTWVFFLASVAAGSSRFEIGGPVSFYEIAIRWISNFLLFPVVYPAIRWIAPSTWIFDGLSGYFLFGLNSFLWALLFWGVLQRLKR